MAPLEQIGTLAGPVGLILDGGSDREFRHFARAFVQHSRSRVPTWPAASSYDTGSTLTSSSPIVAGTTNAGTAASNALVD